MKRFQIASKVIQEFSIAWFSAFYFLPPAKA